MSDEDVVRLPPVSKSLRDEFRDHVRERFGTVRGHYRSEVETALREYLRAEEGGDTHDRLQRIEEDVADIKDALSDEGRKKKKQTSRSHTTERRLQKIKATIADEATSADTVHAQVVEMAIRQHAGGSDPTIRRYTRMLEQDRVLFPDPLSDTQYFRTPEAFVAATNAYTKSGKLDQESYDRVIDEYGEDWWREVIDRMEDDSGRGFQ